MLYLDHAASSPLRPEVWAAMEPFRLDVYGNPSGSHAISRRAKNALEDSRELVASLINADPSEIVFTGGGSEADNLAIKGRAFSDGRRGAIITSPTEHDAVLMSAEHCESFGSVVNYAKVASDGLVDPAEVASHVTADTAVVSIMMGNNETGVRMPVEEVATAVKSCPPRGHRPHRRRPGLRLGAGGCRRSGCRPAISRRAQVRRSQGRGPSLRPVRDSSCPRGSWRWAGTGPAVRHP